MKETIGNVTLDYTFYPGQDLYSDGKVEEELLDISRAHKESELNQVIAKRKSWPVLYHFSHVRQNIVSWLPIRADETVLEIGSGCGAITGALASKAKKVTCIELSKKRSLVNAHRHQEYSNIEILLGNFQDVVQSLEEAYDYVTLIGVFEYSECYINSNNPYVDMLKIISPLLKPNGKLVIAIENRLGLKYWAGCTEDHTGTFFEGIEGYPDTKGVKTFSKTELENVLRESGEYDCQMYYPYPDYKFPMSLYSDKRVPAVGELREINYNFDRARVRLFDETRVADSLISNNLFPEFSNSYLVVATKKGYKSEIDTVYVKFSNERSEEFSLRTEIKENEFGKKAVEKAADSKNGISHIQHIHRCYEKLSTLYQNTPIVLNTCEYQTNKVKLEYLEGRTLEQLLDALVEEKQYDSVWCMLEQYIDVLKSVAAIPFTMTDEFRRVFGDVAVPADELCATITNIDAICANIIWEDNKWTMLDYEWSFEFPVPVRYQIYRVLKYYLYTSTMRGCLQKFDYFQRAGISKREIEIFDHMEEHFQQYILGEMVPMRNLYSYISPGSIQDVKKLQAIDKYLRVYMDYGEDFSEDNSWTMPREADSFNGMIEVPKDAVRVRIDPCEQYCVARVLRLCGKIKGTEIEIPFISNGELLENGLIMFATPDPYLVIEHIPDGLEAIYVEMEMECVDKKEKSLVGEIWQYSNRMTQKNRELRERIEQMENTKVWKAYSIYKGRGKK